MEALGTGLTPPMYKAVLLTFFSAYVLYIPSSWTFLYCAIPKVEFLRLWLLAQMDAYEYSEKGAGWFFWSAKIQVV